MGYRVVCISSHDGAGSAQAADIAATTLNFRLIDEDIVTRAAVEAGVDEEVVADVERRKSVLARLLEGLAPAGMAVASVPAPPEFTGYGQPASDELRQLIRTAIEDMAMAGNVVIVAHAASFALQGRGDVLRILITASASTRQSRLAGKLGVDDKDAERFRRRSDAGRSDYIKRFYGIAEEEPTHYDLVVNTDRLTPEDAARLIVSAATAPS